MGVAAFIFTSKYYNSNKIGFLSTTLMTHCFFKNQCCHGRFWK